MANPVFKLEFLSPQKGKDRPFSPKARIGVESFTQDSADGTPFVSNGATSYTEFKTAVDGLLKELKSIRKDGKRRFADHEKDSMKSKKKK